MTNFLQSLNLAEIIPIIHINSCYIISPHFHYQKQHSIVESAYNMFQEALQEQQMNQFQHHHISTKKKGFSFSTITTAFYQNSPQTAIPSTNSNNLNPHSGTTTPNNTLSRTNSHYHNNAVSNNYPITTSNNRQQQSTGFHASTMHIPVVIPFVTLLSYFNGRKDLGDIIRNILHSTPTPLTPTHPTTSSVTQSQPTTPVTPLTPNSTSRRANPHENHENLPLGVPHILYSYSTQDIPQTIIESVIFLLRWHVLVPVHSYVLEYRNLSEATVSEFKQNNPQQQQQKSPVPNVHTKSVAVTNPSKTPSALTTMLSMPPSSSHVHDGNFQANENEESSSNSSATANTKSSTQKTAKTDVTAGSAFLGIDQNLLSSRLLNFNASPVINNNNNTPNIMFMGGLSLNNNLSNGNVSSNSTNSFETIYRFIQRDVQSLKYLSSMSVTEIACLCNVSVNEVESVIQKGGKWFRLVKKLSY
jgi:hypothetical protein